MPIAECIHMRQCSKSLLYALKKVLSFNTLENLSGKGQLKILLDQTISKYKKLHQIAAKGDTHFIVAVENDDRFMPHWEELSSWRVCIKDIWTALAAPETEVAYTKADVNGIYQWRTVTLLTGCSLFKNIYHTLGGLAPQNPVCRCNAGYPIDYH